MFVSRQIIRTGSPEGDRKALADLEAYAASWGLTTHVQYLPGGGMQVDLLRATPGPYRQGQVGHQAPSAPVYGAPPTMARYAPSQLHTSSQCESCGRNAPTKHVTFRQNIGLVVLRIPKTVAGNMCRACIGKHFWQTTLVSSTLGWWGVISFFYTLVTIPMNVVEYMGARSLPEQ